MITRSILIDNDRSIANISNVKVKNYIMHEGEGRMFNFDHRNKDSYTDMENIIQNVYFMAHPVYTASQVMKILLAAECVKYLTKSFSLENSSAASRSIRFSVDRRCTTPPRVSPSNERVFNVSNRS